MVIRYRWTRPGTLPIVLAVLWAFVVTLFFLAFPIALSGETIVQAGGFPTLVTVLLPLGATGALLTIRGGAEQRRRWVLVVAVLLTLFGILVPIPIAFYFVSAIALWAAYATLRRAV
jgi:hypothetical protein